MKWPLGRELIGVAALVAVACGGREVPRGPSTPPRADASVAELDAATPPPPPPPAAVSVTVERAGWLGFTGTPRLAVAVVLVNGAGAAAASLDPAAFHVDTRGGARVAPGTSTSTRACSARLSVVAGGSVGCDLLFELPAGHFPDRLGYVDGTRTASAALPECSVGQPAGLCAFGQGCRRGVCEGPCGGRLCPGEQICFAGACEDECSPSHPQGVCPAGGGCVAGQCDLSCHSLSLRTGSCMDCIQRSTCLSGVFRCDNGGAVMACLGCLDARDVCACEASAECATCMQPNYPFRDYLDCVATECPVCLR